MYCVHVARTFIERGEDEMKRRGGMRLILLLGLVSLFGDITYEGARGVIGPYLSLLGASALIVGLASGLGELTGYGLRLLSGYLADRTGRYWLLTGIGYFLLISIPLLAFAWRWEIALLLILVERMGKAVRSPARDAIISHASREIGRGTGFGIHEALDQVGALIGPLLFSAILLRWEYREAFQVTLIPVILAMVFLSLAKSQVPAPRKLESTESKGEIPREFWFYLVFTFVSVVGFLNFPLMAYHLKVNSILEDPKIPLLYALAMGVDALIALLVGRAYDKVGFSSLFLVPILTPLVPFLFFSGHLVLGILAWGSVMAIQETIMRAAVADLTPPGRRGTAYGIFNTAYGLSWLIGGASMGLIYEFSWRYIYIFSIGMELLSLPFLLRITRRYLTWKKGE